MAEAAEDFDIYEDTGEVQNRLFPKAEPPSNGAVPPTSVSFARIANAAIDRGLSVIPLLPESKDPCSHLATRGAKSRTRNRDLVAAWAQELPNGNVGICSDDEITILESDDEARFRRLVREVSGKLFGVSRELPTTLTSQARSNRPHWFFKNTERTRQHRNSPGIAGLYEWRHSNQYVVGFGSIHPLGMPYQIVLDTEIVSMPDWLVTVLEEIRVAYQGTTNAASTFVKVGPAGIAIEALKAKYFLDAEAMLADPEFELEVTAGERHYFLNSIAGLLHNGARTDEEIFDLLCQFRDKYCDASDEKGDAEVRRIAEWVARRDPCVADIDSLLPEYGYWIGLKWFLYEDDFLKEYGRQALAKEATEKATVDWSGNWFFDADDFLREEVPPRAILAEELNGTPVLYGKSLNQIFAFRGLGKTMFVHGLVNILIHGGEFLRYKSNGGMRVLIADGELPDVQLQERLMRSIGESNGLLKLMSPERMPGNIFPRLSERKWQIEFLRRIELLKPDVVVFDTLTGCFKFDTNDPDTWREVNGFLIELRIRGLCVILVHHAGKAGTQRGRTDGDDNLDLSIKLDAPKGWAPGDGLEIAVSYEKVRAGGRLGEFCAAYRESGKWELTQDETRQQAFNMLLLGKSIRAIATALDMTPSAVFRVKRQAQKNGISFPAVKAGRGAKGDA